MAEKVASLFVEIGAETSKLESGLNRTKTGLNDAAKQAGGMGAALKTALTSAAVIAGVNALVSGIKYMVAQAMEAETVMRATEATIKATGGAAGYTAEQIADLAGAESRLTSIDDEVIQSGLNMLLTFKQIGGETLPRATRAMEDMAVAMAKGDTSAIDLQGTAIQLGKALNDPIAGATALRRVGVTLSEQQQQQIKDFMAVNDIASAQAIILGELESEFGGMAETMGNTTAGKFEKLKNSFNNIAEAIGSDLLPVLNEAADATLLIMGYSDSLNAAYVEQETNLENTATSYTEYARGAIAAADAAGQLDARQTRMAQALADGVMSAEDERRVTLELADALGLTDEKTWNVQQSTTDWMEDLDGTAQAADIATVAIGGYNAAITDADAQSRILSSGMQNLTKELIFNAAAENLSADEALKLGLQMGVLNTDTVGAMTSLEILNGQLATGQISALEYRDAVAALGQQIEDEANNPHTITVDVRMNDQELNDFMAEWHDLGPGGPVVGALPGGGGQQQPIARAIGGSVKAGYPVKWQEVGGEVMVPERDGTVLSHGDLMRMINALSAGSGNARGNQTVNFYGYQQPEQIAQRLAVLEAFGV